MVREGTGKGLRYMVREGRGGLRFMVREGRGMIKVYG